MVTARGGGGSGTVTVRVSDEGLLGYGRLILIVWTAGALTCFRLYAYVPGARLESTKLVSEGPTVVS